MPPTVSVMIATYNAGRLLTPWMRSPPRASLRSGSRSSLSTMVQRMAWSYLSELEGSRSNIKIFQQKHTGGPSAGHRRALSEATGTYAFFHDADDYLGADALRRHRPGRAAESDIVVPRVSWIGRPDAERRSGRTVLDADILDDGVWRALTPHKLIRQALIEDLGLRFCDDMVQVKTRCSWHPSLRRAQDQHPRRQGPVQPAHASRWQQPVSSTSDARQQATDPPPKWSSSLWPTPRQGPVGIACFSGSSSRLFLRLSAAIHGGWIRGAQGVPRCDAGQKSFPICRLRC